MARDSLFDGQCAQLPTGFEYYPAFISLEDEQRLLAAIAQTEFSQVVMRGVVARRRTAKFGWTYGYERRDAAPGAHEIELAPRSAYLIRGKARRDFEHSIPPVEKRRSSITFRTLTR